LRSGKISLKGYYIQAQLNREGKGEFQVEAIIYHHPSKQRFYILSAYNENTGSSDVVLDVN
jgi:hypothetical protein